MDRWNCVREAVRDENLFRSPTLDLGRFGWTPNRRFHFTWGFGRLNKSGDSAKKGLFSPNFRSFTPSKAC
jgi:hypothetical protein